tara:strand:- start:393 stop:578 length:186 start_codon:yes stop_codon:yes gene_type:complete
MQFQKKTRAGNFSSISKLLIKLILVVSFFFVVIILIDKIKFPAPNKLIEKKIPNENFKIIK